MTTKQYQLIIRTIIWAMPIILFVWIVNQNVVLFGQATYHCSADNCNAQIRNIASREKEIVTGVLKGTKERYRMFTTNPLTFDTQLFRVMKQATVKLTYKDGRAGNRLTLSVIGGVGTQQQTYNFGDTSSILTTLESGWNAVQSGDLTVFQKRDENVTQFSSVEEFIARAPDRKDVGTYHVDLSSYAKIPSYVPSSAPRVFRVSTRGSHSFLVYVGKDEDLNVRFSVQNSNRNTGKDPFTVLVFHGEETLLKTAVTDNGTGKGDGKLSPERDVSVVLKTPGEGTYRIDVVMNSDDQFIRSITTAQRYFVWNKTLYSAGSSEYRAMGDVEIGPLVLYMKGTTLTASTSHASMLQTITVGGKKLAITKTHKAYTVTVPASVDFVPVVVPNRDVLLKTDGVFVLSKDTYFSTALKNIIPLTGSSDPKELSYVIAKYVPVQQQGDWSTVEKIIPNLPEGRTLHFSISADPPIAAGDGALRVKDLTVRLTGRPLGFSDASKALQRIVKGNQ